MIWPVLSPPLWGLVFTVTLCVLLWLLSLRRGDVSSMDLCWGPGIAGVVDIAALLSHVAGSRAATALFLVNIWALRLALYLWARRDSDPRAAERRYGAMRRHFGHRWKWWSLVQVFLLQAILIWFIPAPLVAVMLAGGGEMNALAYAGVALSVAGLLFEALADFQLAAFRSDPAHAGQVMDRGLWAWSRHPNYFGEVVLWLGFFVLGFSASHAWWLILSPLLVCFLLLQVSGIPVVEDGIGLRRPAYGIYRRKVSSFLPMWPRS